MFVKTCPQVLIHQAINTTTFTCILIYLWQYCTLILYANMSISTYNGSVRHRQGNLCHTQIVTTFRIMNGDKGLNLLPVQMEKLFIWMVIQRTWVATIVLFTYGSQKNKRKTIQAIHGLITAVEGFVDEVLGRENNQTELLHKYLIVGLLAAYAHQDAMNIVR